jgi:maltose alpha-D-glucosyltransferase/alpha-amylase
MGEDLRLPGREAIRTPMQWSYKANAGFSTASARELVRPVITGGDFGFEQVNVTTQRHDPTSLLAWFERMIRTLREAPEIGTGTCSHVDLPLPRSVLAHRADGQDGTLVFLHNLDDEKVTVDLSPLADEADQPNDILSDQDYEPMASLDSLDLAGYGYRWIRLHRNP